jgi:hypothetical protein
MVTFTKQRNLTNIPDRSNDEGATQKQSVQKNHLLFQQNPTMSKALFIANALLFGPTFVGATAFSYNDGMKCSTHVSIEVSSLTCDVDTSVCDFGNHLSVTGSLTASEDMPEKSCLTVDTCFMGLYFSWFCKTFTDTVDTCDRLSLQSDDVTCPAAGSYQFSLEADIGGSGSSNSLGKGAYWLDCFCFHFFWVRFLLAQHVLNFFPPHLCIYPPYPRSHNIISVRLFATGWWVTAKMTIKDCDTGSTYTKCKASFDAVGSVNSSGNSTSSSSASLVAFSAVGVLGAAALLLFARRNRRIGQINLKHEEHLIDQQETGFEMMRDVGVRV